MLVGVVGLSLYLDMPLPFSLLPEPGKLSQLLLALMDPLQGTLPM